MSQLIFSSVILDDKTNLNSILILIGKLGKRYVDEWSAVAEVELFLTACYEKQQKQLTLQVFLETNY